MTNNPLDLYVCPKCKGKLQQRPTALNCPVCQRAYAIINDIPDFLLLGPQEGANFILRNSKKISKLAWIYETKLCYPLILNLFGGWHTLNFQELIVYAHEKLLPVKGLVLDVATGTGTYGRHVAGAERTVYGIDITLEMMYVGQAYVKREGRTNIHFSRADVEALPFGDCLFDGCLTFGSLHLFRDTHKALTEISRTIKSGAPLVVFTFTRGKTGILKYEWMRRRRRLKVFELPDLQRMLDKAGFEQFEPDIRGAILLFTARKR